MKNSNTYSAARLPFLILGLALIFSGCRGTQTKGFSKDIERHFEGQKYNQIIVTGNKDFNQKSELKTLKGKGTFNDAEEKPINYSWYFVMDDKGEIGTFYLASPMIKKMGRAELSKSDYDLIFGHCKSLSDKSKSECINALVLRAKRDCVFSNTPESCAENCWFSFTYCGVKFP